MASETQIYVRFRRWAEQGIWDALLETLVELGLIDDRRHMIDSTTVRGHSQAAGAEEGPVRRALVEAAPAKRSKIHAYADGQGRSLGVMLTGGEISDQSAVSALLAMPVAKPRLMLADKDSDGDDVRPSLRMRGAMPVIPPKADRRAPAACDFRQYQDRNRIERMFNRLEQARRIATRYDKTAASMAFLCLAASRIRLKDYVDRS